MRQTNVTNVINKPCYIAQMPYMNWCKIPNGGEMNVPSFDTVLLLVFFIYGLAFFSLGMSLAVESGRFPALADARVLRPLAIFGLAHGTHEWLEAYLMQADSSGAPLP